MADLSESEARKEWDAMDDTIKVKSERIISMHRAWLAKRVEEAKAILAIDWQASGFTEDYRTYWEQALANAEEQLAMPDPLAD